MNNEAIQCKCGHLKHDHFRQGIKNPEHHTGCPFCGCMEFKLKVTSVKDMGKLVPLSPTWFDCAFEGVSVPRYVREASERICTAYNIRGQSDPGYIANVINAVIIEDRRRP